MTEIEDSTIATVTRLPSGEELQGEALNAAASAHPSRLIIIGGEPESGKTTLLTALFEQFRLGPFAGFLFAGSRTLPAFERRCHLSRIASGRAAPETERTRAGSLSFLHLAVQDIASQQRCDLLLSDISGEDFAAARDSTGDAQRLRLITHASRFVLLVDAAACQTKRTRHLVLANARLLLRSLLEAAVLTATSAIDIVLTKLDVLARASQEELAFTDSILKNLSKDFAPRVRQLDIYKIAARPANEPTLINVGELLKNWCAPNQSPLTHYVPDRSSLISPFDRFEVPKDGALDDDE